MGAVDMPDKKIIRCGDREWEVELSQPLGHGSSLAGNLPEPNERALRFTSGSERHVMRVGLEETLEGFENLCELLRLLRERA